MKWLKKIIKKFKQIENKSMIPLIGSVSFYILFSPYWDLIEKFDFLSYSTILLSCLFVILMKIVKKKKFSFKWTDYILFIFPLLYIVSMLFDSSITSLSTNITYILLLISFVLSALLIKNEGTTKQINFVLKSIIVSMSIYVLLSLGSVIDSFLYDNIIYRSYFGDYFTTSIYRMYGQIGYPGATALMLLIGFFLSFYFSEKEKNNKSLYYSSMYFLSLGFILTFSKYLAIVFGVASLIFIFVCFITKKYKYIWNLLSIILSLILPIILLVNKFRIYYLTKNFLVFLIYLIIGCLLFLGNYYLLKKLYEKRKKVFALSYIIETIIIALIIAFPISKNLVLKNCTGIQSVIITDIMNLWTIEDYNISVDIINHSSDKMVFRFIKHYKYEGITYTKIKEHEELKQGMNHISWDFTVDESYNFYYFDFQKLTPNTDLEIGDVILTNRETGEKTIYHVDYYLNAYQFLHQLIQLQQDKDSVTGRTETYNQVIDICKDQSCLTGFGKDSFSHYLHNYEHGIGTSEEHSYPLKLLVEVGIFGFIFYIVLIILDVVMLWINRKNDETLFFGTILLAIIGASIFDINLGFDYLMFMLIIFNTFIYIKNKK